MAVDTSIERGAYHIANNGLDYNPQRKNNFTLIIHGLDGLSRMGAVDESLGELTDSDIIFNGQEQLVLSLRSCTTPNITQGVININRGNSTIRFAGKPVFNTLSIEAYDYIGSDAKDILLAWQNQCYNPRYDVVGYASNYKFSGELLQLTPDGSLVRYWEIKGLWPSAVEAGDFSYDEGDTAQTVRATLQYDWAMLRTDDYSV